MKTAILPITTGGNKLAELLVGELTGASILSGKGIAKVMAENWPQYDAFICVMATGIAVRAIAPLLLDKRTDPCVIVVDERGRYAISLVSGHIGGGNELARQVARITGGEAVITTASDTLGLVALDIWAQEQGLAASRDDLTWASAKLVNNGSLIIYSEVEVHSLASGLHLVDNTAGADIIISNKEEWPSDAAVFCPRNLVLGVGCNRGTPAAEFSESLNELFADLHLNRNAIRNLASIDKKNDEQGLLAFAEQNNWSIDFFTNGEINKITDIEVSPAALKAVGAIGVAEPTALLSAGLQTGRQNKKIRDNPSPSVVQRNNSQIKLISRKRKWQSITMAVAQVPFTLSVPAPAV